MAKNDTSTPKGAYMGGPSISAEDFNTALRSDAATSYGKGPTQTKYKGLDPADRAAIINLGTNAQANSGILRDAYKFNQGILTNDPQSNPYLDDIISKTNDNTYADVMASLGSTGMVGSNLHSKELGNALADNESRLRYDDYNAGVNRQFAASDRAQGLYEGLLAPDQTKIAANTMLNADERARAAFDPQYEHLLKYQGLLGNNAGGPQPAKQPGFMDYAGLGLGLLGSFL